ncbi:MAG: 2-oxoacid:ferredoxin oxidoreductase subunit beta [Thermoleophilia bacterium]|nr:2-oxoacid:ferredoxin oxidoreductase subunit beta [Thermoleophilia bacterium]
MKTAPRTYEPTVPIWCAGCGHFGVLSALQQALRDLGIPQHEVLVLAGIGCSGTIQNYVGAYGYHALHGRVLPAAAGVALANPRLTVIGAGGDGDGYAIGMGHLVHAFRRNVPFTYLLMNNETYGLTKGQRSPGRRADGTSVRDGSVDGPLLGLSIPATTFVARGYSGWFDQLARLTAAALEHARGGHGFAFLEVISPCVTYQDTYPEWEAVLHDVEREPGYDPTDRGAALARAAALVAEGRLPAGLIFRAASAGPPPDEPVPAHAPIEGEDLAARYRALLDRYAVGARPEPAHPRAAPVE